ncbi:leucine-rich repeat-containing protein 16B-like, partial [Poecilia latipinna]|uniref:leucine-rich repeat-containing protein 16B-like n=1 Tax=Poecilia latipinna TaxID=48699 RepID=UPI00072E40BD
MASKENSAAGFVSVSREITESIRKVLDKQPVKFVRAIKQETRGGKSEDRILVLATWRLYLFAVKVPTKVEVTFNFLEIRAMNTYPDFQVVIDTDKTTFSLRLQTQEQLDHVVNHINYALSRVFNNSIYAPPICRAEGDVPDGSHKFSPNSESSLEPPKTCGGFSETYAALCDYNGIGCKEEVQWDVDTIYHSQDNREFNLLDFSHLDSRDLAVIVASIAYNTWFTKLYCKDMRIGSEVVDQILHTVSKSNSLEELTLENAGLKADFPQKMASALSENPASVIHSLNLAHNTLDNQGVSNLIQQVCRLNKGLRLLNLSKTSLSSKGRQSKALSLTLFTGTLLSFLKRNETWHKVEGGRKGVPKRKTPLDTGLDCAGGYRLQFAVRPPRFKGVLVSVANRDSVHVLEDEIASLLAKRSIRVVPEEEVHQGFYSRYFLIPKKDGLSLRPILDL